MFFLFDSLYPWSKKDNVPYCATPFPRKEHEVLGEWSWGKVKPAKLELLDEYQISRNGMGKHEHWDKIDWSEDEYTWYQFVPTDTRENWNEWLTQYQLVKDKEPLHGPQHNYKHLEVFNIDDIFYRVNTNGFRADTFKKNDNRLKIMSLGCSFTFGIGVMQGDEWPNKLAQKYNAVNWNMGVGGGSSKLQLMIAEHMFRIGYVPDIVCVVWPHRSRTVIPGKSKFQTMIDPVVPQVHIKSLQDYKRFHHTWAKITNSVGDLPELNPDKRDEYDYESYENRTTNFHPGDDSDPDWAPLVRNTDEYKSKLLNIGTEAELLEFNDHRTKLNYLCKAYGVKLFETFIDPNAHQLAMDLYETEPFWQSETPMCWVANNLDKGRDGMHWGPLSHQLVSNHFAKLIGEDT